MPAALFPSLCDGETPNHQMGPREKEGQDARLALTSIMVRHGSPGREWCQRAQLPGPQGGHCPLQARQVGPSSLAWEAESLCLCQVNRDLKAPSVVWGTPAPTIPCEPEIPPLNNENYYICP